MTVEIRRVVEFDGSIFERVGIDVFDAPPRAEYLRDYLSDPSHRMVIATSHGEIVGQIAAVLHRHPDKPTELYIDEVAVTPAFQRQGVAQRMMAEMIAWGWELGCIDVWLGTETDNESAKALYARYAEPEPFLMYLWKVHAVDR
ncbi:MAG: GNAT family N-acetyltransferase [Planctomycetota bacterium]